MEIVVHFTASLHNEFTELKENSRGGEKHFH